MSADKYQMDMCHGSLPGKIIIFALPLLFTGILQLLFNAVDLMVLGKFAPVQSMAAVGATLSMHSLVINVFIGTSIGANVVAANLYGAKNYSGVRRTVSTAVIFAVTGGLCVMSIGLLIGKPLLILMKTPGNILEGAWTYTKICFCGIPFIMIYNYGCALLRAIGDTKRPLYFLMIAGVVNVGLNIIFVKIFAMDVSGVAFATVASHALSAAMVFVLLLKNRGCCRFSFKLLLFDWKIMWKMLQIGIPAGLQSSCFAVSNMLIQSSVNFFGDLAVAGRTAVQSLEGICYIASFAFHQTAISFVAQNLGGNKHKRILKSVLWCTLMGCVSSGILGMVFVIFGRPLIGIFTSDQQAVEWGMISIHVLCTTYWLCGIMDVSGGGLRGIGWSFVSAVNSLVWACLFRVFWILCILPHHNTMQMLLLSYPISWVLTAVVNWTLFLIICRKLAENKVNSRVALAGLRPGIPKGIRFFGTK